MGQRKQLKDKTITKSIEKISEKQADRAADFITMTDTLAGKLAAALASVDPTDTQALRRIAASMRDLAEMQGLKSDLDRQEQQARIDNLRKQADKDDHGEAAPTLVVEGLPEEFKV